MSSEDQDTSAVDQAPVEENTSTEQAPQQTTANEQAAVEEVEQPQNEQPQTASEPTSDVGNETASAADESATSGSEQDSQSATSDQEQLSESSVVNNPPEEKQPQEPEAESAAEPQVPAEEPAPESTPEPEAAPIVTQPAEQAPVYEDNNTAKYLHEEGGFEVKTAEGTVIVKPSELPAPTTSIMEQQKVILDEINSELDRLLEGVSPTKRVPFEQIKQYMIEMAPKKQVNHDVGKRHQKALIGALTTILNQADDEGTFTQQFTALLKVFHLGQKHALNELHVFRFLEHVELRHQDIEAFTRLVNMLLVTSDVKSRPQTIKQLDFEKTLRFGLSDQARRRILDFYGV